MKLQLQKPSLGKKKSGTFANMEEGGANVQRCGRPPGGRLGAVESSPVGHLWLPAVGTRREENDPVFH